MGVTSIQDIIGRTDMLDSNQNHSEKITAMNIDLSYFIRQSAPLLPKQPSLFGSEPSDLNLRILKDVEQLNPSPTIHKLQYKLGPQDRAVLATLNGYLGQQRGKKRFNLSISGVDLESRLSQCEFEFVGSAGQGFAAFNQSGIDVCLMGEANDSVAKSMSGGRVVIVPQTSSKIIPEDNTILGNCTLYGATSGQLFVRGIAGDRFAVRNSGATAVVEGVGMHACEYMTRGTVVVLGQLGSNIGAGMTGGQLFIRRSQSSKINLESVVVGSCNKKELEDLFNILKVYESFTHSTTAQKLIEQWPILGEEFVMVRPKKTVVEKPTSAPEKVI
jgi:glutamate synthase domain-containing protein 3